MTTPDTFFPNLFSAFEAEGIQLSPDHQRRLQDFFSEKNRRWLTQKPVDFILDRMKELILDLAKDGITLGLGNYVAAALKQPQLFYQSPTTIAANLRGVRDELAKDGITLDLGNYVAAALKQPQLFYQSPTTIADNLRGVPNELAKDGITLGLTHYVVAALKHPSLFTYSPATIAGNLRGVRDELAKDGVTLDLGNYVAAALKQPPLFCQSPTTIAAHFSVLMEMRAGQCNNNDAAIVRILADPIKLCLATDNLRLRLAASLLELSSRGSKAALRTRILDAAQQNDIHPTLQKMAQRTKAKTMKPDMAKRLLNIFGPPETLCRDRFVMEALVLMN